MQLLDAAGDGFGRDPYFSGQFNLLGLVVGHELVEGRVNEADRDGNRSWPRKFR